MKLSQKTKLPLSAFLLVIALMCLPIIVGQVQKQSTLNSQAAEKTAVETTLFFTVHLHGIGNSGDSLNPTDSSLSTKQPKTTKKDFIVTIYNASNQPVRTVTKSLFYQTRSGAFETKILLGNSLPVGEYRIKIKASSYLRKSLPGTFRLAPRTLTTLPTVSLVAGDFNNDNSMNVLDYNMLMGCYSDFIKAAYCDFNALRRTDISADLKVNHYDYNLFLREITAVQRGD